MMEIPELNNIDVTFGNIRHMPIYDTLPDDFKQHNGNVYCKAVATWFFKGAAGTSERLEIGDKIFTPKPGVDGPKAVAAIRAVLVSFQPKHEHKEAGCAFMLSEWFDMEEPA